jgi:hypothetical protein
VGQELAKILNEISALKNSNVSGCEKMDLETICHNKSRLELSSILEQDIAYDFAEIKAAILEIYQRLNLWFG